VLVVAWMIVCTNAGCTHRLGVDIGGTKMMIALYVHSMRLMNSSQLLNKSSQLELTLLKRMLKWLLYVVLNYSYDMI